MKYAFFGSPEFAAIILEKLIGAGMPPTLVVCNPDKPSGRKQVIIPLPAKIVAEKYNISAIQPENFDAKIVKYFEMQNLDFSVVAAYAKILPLNIIKLPKLGTIGVHPSLLPKYRGTTPIQSAILNGEKETGTTLYMLDEKVDHGEILANRVQSIASGDNYTSLMGRLANLSGDLLIETLPKFMDGKIKPQPQNESQATFTKKFSTEDGFINLEKEDPIAIERKILALNPEPGAWTVKNEKRIKILDQTTIQFAGKKPRAVENAVTFLKSL